ncbi:MAG TPA: TMEM165/GDT1 family protein [Jatrophihabitantaceae bacterium]
MFDPLVIAPVFGLIFVAELPDKTAIASLILGTKYRASWVFAGVAAAFAIHVVIAVAAGSLIAQLPRRPVEAVVGVLFLAGAIALWRRTDEDEEVDETVGELPADAGFRRVTSTAFAVIFVAEFGDLTQILCANLAAHYNAPVAVGIGATLGLWAVGLLAILGGRALLRVIPVHAIVRVACVAMAALAVYSVFNAIRG